MYISIFSGIALILAVVVTWYLRKRKKRSETPRANKRLQDEFERPIREWLDKAKQTRFDDEALLALGNPPKGWNDFDEVPHFLMRLKNARESRAARIKYENKARAQIISAYHESNFTRRYNILFGINTDYVANHEDREWIEQQRATLTIQYADILLQNARTGDGDSFDRLNNLTKISKYGYNHYRSRCHEDYLIPDDWNDLAASCYESPTLDDFRAVDHKGVPGEILILAAEAMKNRSLRDAKIVLAFCTIERYVTSNGSNRQIYWPWRSEIGGVMMADLANMVVAIHAERHIFTK